MRPRYQGDAPARSRIRRRRAALAPAGKIIDFQEEAKRRAIAETIVAGESALFLVRRLMERYPLFFEEPEHAAIREDMRGTPDGAVFSGDDRCSYPGSKESKG
jgi:hypothetical protein